MSDFKTPVEEYQAQLDAKIALTKNEFIDFGAPELEVFPSPPTQYRMRAEFKAWQQDGSVSYAMYKQGEYKAPYTIENYEPGSSTMQQLMPVLLDAIHESDALKHKLFQIEFLTTTTGQAVITLIYHKPLAEPWLLLAKTLSERLGVHIIGRSRKQKLVVGEIWIEERLKIAGREYRYQHIEGSFTQPNAFICQDMLNWAVKHSTTFGGNLLELYCGNGNFTLPLAQNFNRVLATEVSKVSIRSAKFNCEVNSVSNIDFVRMSSEEITEALAGVRPFRRLSNIQLDDFEFSTIFVDPPRAGLDENTTKLLQQFENIIYISCNPETLGRNLKSIEATHEIVHAALFDQFPYTNHREVGTILKRRK